MWILVLCKCCIKKKKKEKNEEMEREVRKNDKMA